MRWGRGRPNRPTGNLLEWPPAVAGDNSHYTTDSDEKQPERGVNSFVISGKMMDKPRGKGYNIA